MTAIAGAVSGNGHEVLADLLHLVSQPLTTLHCALEISAGREETDSSKDVARSEVGLALAQTERVIEAVRLMREYLEVEQGCIAVAPVAFDAAVKRAVEQVSVLAEGCGVELYVRGSSNAIIPLCEMWLQRALVYLIAECVERSASGSEVAITLQDGDSGTVLSLEMRGTQFAMDRVGRTASDTVRKARLAIAQRVFESAGASLEFGAGQKPGLVIRIPCSPSVRSQPSAASGRAV